MHLCTAGAATPALPALCSPPPTHPSRQVQDESGMGVPVGFMVVGKGGDTSANVALFLRTLMEGVRAGTEGRDEQLNIHPHASRSTCLPPADRRTAMQG